MAEAILFVGLGSIGQRHLKNLHLLYSQQHGQQQELPLFIVLRQSAAQRPKKEEMDHVPIINVQSMDEAFSYHPSIAFICTPTQLHVDQAIPAAQHQCHLFIEKPLSNTFDHVEELYHLVKKHNLITMVGCVLRFHPVIKKVEELLHQHTIGNVYHFAIEVGQYLPNWIPTKDYRESYRTKAEAGGVVLELIHEIDYARFLFGEYEVIAGLTGKQSSLDIQVEDTAKMVCRMKSGVLGTISLDFLQQPFHRSVKIVGSQGTIIADLNKGEVTIERPTGAPEIIQLPSVQDRNAMYVEELRHFLDCVKRKQQTIIPIEEGIQSLAAALQVKQIGAMQNSRESSPGGGESHEGDHGCCGHCQEEVHTKEEWYAKEENEHKEDKEGSEQGCCGGGRCRN
ncbi:Gfo/Idh/MocA family oxidoreductase [Candidatus Woesearchaeota archaeon]|nr:Gfo/Idh/MocA family oxidoreductase [Candidatus Woesearchaeota archaeon]